MNISGANRGLAGGFLLMLANLELKFFQSIQGGVMIKCYGKALEERLSIDRRKSSYIVSAGDRIT